MGNENGETVTAVMSSNKDVLLHQGWRSPGVKGKHLWCQFQKKKKKKKKNPAKSSVGRASWEVEKWNASQNDSAELVINKPSPFFWMDRMKVSFLTHYWNSLVSINPFLTVQKRPYMSCLLSVHRCELMCFVPIQTLLLCGCVRTQQSLDYTTDKVTALHLQGLAVPTQTVVFLCLPCPFGL